MISIRVVVLELNHCHEHARTPIFVYQERDSNKHLSLMQGGGKGESDTSFCHLFPFLLELSLCDAKMIRFGVGVDNNSNYGCRKLECYQLSSNSNGDDKKGILNNNL